MGVEQGSSNDLADFRMPISKERVEDPEKARQEALAEAGSRESAVALRQAAADVRGLIEKYPGPIGQQIAKFASGLEAEAKSWDGKADTDGEIAGDNYDNR